MGNINNLVFDSLNYELYENSWKISVRNTLQHHLNPMHMMCRARNCGLSPKTAKNLAGKYEKHIYNPISKLFPNPNK